MRFLNAFCMGVAIAMMVAIFLLVLLQMVSRMIGQVIPGIDEFAAYAVAILLCFGLGPVLASDGHVRVKAVIQRLPERTAALVEVCATVVAVFIACLLTWSLFDFTHDSWLFNERATTLLPTPLWIPRIAMAVGSLGLIAASVHRLARCLAVVAGRAEMPAAQTDVLKGAE